MRSEISAEAYLDALAILGDAPASIVPMSIVEMHLYAYLGCILGLFRGHPVAGWGYTFAITSEGFPYSVQFDEARQVLLFKGLAVQDDNGLLEADRENMAAEMTTVLSFSHFETRREWLRTATNCALAFPVGAIRHAINNSPGVETPLKLGQRRQLLQVDDVELLYDEHQAVQAALGPDVQDLLSPAVLWLSARVLRTGVGDV
jgi:hypothetical protein